MNLRKILKKMGVGAASALTFIALMAGTSFASTLPTEAATQQMQTVQPQALPQTQPQNASVTSKWAYLKVKAEVGENFTAPIEISYYGASGKEFTVNLTVDNGYVTTIPVEQDAYTLKGLNSPAGIDMAIAKSFSLVNADPQKIYSLPVSVYQSTTQSEAAQTYVKVKVTAKESAVAVGYPGTVAVNYTGTNGNYFYASLSAENDFTQEIEILKDIYSVNAITVEDGFEANAIYSFDLSSASKEVLHTLNVMLEVETQPITSSSEEVVISDGFQAGGVWTEPATPVTQQQAVQTGKTKNGVIHLLDAPADLQGEILVTYTGISSAPISVILNEANKYTAVISQAIPYDTYTLTDIRSTSQSKYTFEAPSIFTVNDSTDSTFVISVSVSNPDSFTEKPASGASLSSTQIMLGILIVLIIAGIVVMVVFMIKRNQGGSYDYSGADDGLEDIHGDDSDVPDSDL